MSRALNLELAIESGDSSQFIGCNKVVKNARFTS